MNQNVIISALLIFLLILPFSGVNAQSDSPVVCAVLFYSPTCGHCEYVINQTILPLIGRYGAQLQIMGIDISQPQGQTLFIAALRKFGIDQGGVPFLVIDNIYLIGSAEIPERFPILVETYMANGGVDWPDLPGLNAVLPTPTSPVVMTALPVSPPASPLATLAPESVSPSSASPSPVNPDLNMIHQDELTWRERFSHDPAGNALSVVVLAGMLGSLVWSVSLFQKTKGSSLKNKKSWIIPLLCVIGSGVAGYLAYVEMTQVTAVCGPVGDCNTVQQSEYARLFGILPIGVLGLIGYAAILITWLIARFTTGFLADVAPLALLGMTVSGTLFSIYLTFLEPLVIGATCAWCLTSAILMTILMLLSVEPAKLAFSKNPFTTSHPRKRPRIGAHDD